MNAREQRLTGGNVAEAVVRVGDTVRKPAHAATDSVEAFLKHLEAAGFSGAPRAMGRDECGRQVLEFIRGSTIDMAQPPSRDELYRIGHLIRELHDTAESFVPPVGARWNVAIQPDAERLICHHDLAPWNLVRDGDRLVFIDWDGSGPGSRLWDLAYAVQSFVPLKRDGDVAEDAVRMLSMVDGYGLSDTETQKLPRLLVDRTRAMYQLLLEGSRTGRQPWARLFEEGHGQYWKSAAEYIEANFQRWQSALETAADREPDWSLKKWHYPSPEE